MSTPLLKDGSFSPSAQPYSPSNALNAKPAQFLRPSDFAILRRMVHSSTNFGGSQTIDGEDGGDILAMILRTGRCRLDSVSGPAMSLGEPRPGTIEWMALDDGRQRPVVAVDGGGMAVPLTPPWYVDTEACICGSVETGLAPRLAGALLAAPPLKANHLSAVRSRLAASLPDCRAHLPPEMQPVQRIKAPLVPRLFLHHRILQSAYYSRAESLDMPLARLSFCYGDHEVASDSSADRPVFTKGTAVFEIERARLPERKAAERLSELGFDRLANQYRWGTPADCQGDLVLGEDLDEDAWIDFMTGTVPGLVADGWRVDVAKDFPVRVAEVDGDIEAELKSGSGIDWFDLHLGVSIEGVRVDLLPAILKLLRQIPADQMEDLLEEDDDDGRMVRLRLGDGRLLSLPMARVRPIMQALASLFAARGVDGDTVRLGKADAADAAAFAEAVPGLVWRGGEHLRELGRRLKDSSGTGDTRDRATPVRRFQQGEVPLFLISLKAGGTGLNLTAADTVIHYDPWWNPAVEAQATDRAHRIGQDKPVFVHKLVALDTIEVKMAELKARKQALADGLFDPEAGSALDVGEDDIEFLLGG